MQQVFRDIILVSDIDGTLVDSRKEIPRRNLEAIAYFKERGGRFTIATGRCVVSAYYAAEKAQVNCPAVTHNGALLSNPLTGEIYWQSLLPEGYAQVVESVLKAFPEVGAQLYVGSRILTVRPSFSTDFLLKIEKMTDIPMAPGAYPAAVNKVLFGGTTAQLEQVRDYLKTSPLPALRQMYGMFTSEIYYEMLEKNITKGSGIRKLAELCGVPAGHVAAIGDFYNDIAMLEAAACPLLTGNSPEEIRGYARHITCTCDEGAIADAVAYLEQEILAGRFPD